MKHSTRSILKKTSTASVLTAALGTAGKLLGKPMTKGLGLGLFVGIVGIQGLMATPAYAISDADIGRYSTAMSSAANAQNIAQVSRLIADDAIISLSRNGKTTNLDKEGYLQLLQKSWAKSSGYRYQIEISDVVATGDQARAQMTTTETWLQDGKPVTIKTSSRVTISQVGNNPVLLRSVAQVTIN
ncbi:DUF4440 domain-containing protein [Moraxella marmotae]|uniref:DUF4440 domain-containing protein n=1 Tax=Moraxella marmotae TaxID=3344520 RepID=UPI0035F45C66